MSINRGHRNHKWTMLTTCGARFFVKQYHPKRFSLSKLKQVEVTLQIQDTLHKQGVHCPKPLTLGGKYLCTTISGVHFVCMEHSKGTLVSPGSLNNSQLYHLGKTTGYMHKILRKIPSSKLHWIPTYQKIEEKWDNQWTNAQLNQRSDRVYRALQKQKEILDKIDFDLFNDCTTGWTHWDLWMDNLLFDTNQVAAILDFDRMRYVFPDLDVSRVLLSGAYSLEKGMNWYGISHFLTGYNEFLPFTSEKLAKAFQLTWCQESPWWITHDIEGRDETPKRFFEEICWISVNWNHLVEITRSHVEVLK